ncbi:hypothetical protein [Tabrizicola flagellatus]|uniref:hypothetical protein n=1 Tax=Tabrizicola flagellatus TaxID=2593021 RepID=UPI0011F20DE6|nr:hypothetical protein [Tabrizicola flagellatus]
MLTVLGVLVLSAVSAGGEAIAQHSLRFACLSSARVDPDRLAEICTDFLDVLGAEPGYRVLGSQNSGLTEGPGLEIDVIRATATQLELVPTWIDAKGQRTVMPSTGFVIMDTAMTEAMRTNLFRKILASAPR